MRGGLAGPCRNGWAPRQSPTSVKMCAQFTRRVTVAVPEGVLPLGPGATQEELPTPRPRQQSMGIIGSSVWMAAADLFRTSRHPAKSASWENSTFTCCELGGWGFNGLSPHSIHILVGPKALWQGWVVIKYARVHNAAYQERILIIAAPGWQPGENDLCWSAHTHCTTFPIHTLRPHMWTLHGQ